MVRSEEDIVTLIPRFVITDGPPPVRQSAPAEQTETASSDSARDLWAPTPDDVSDTLMPADIDDFQTPSRLPARSMLRRLPSLLD